MDKNVAPLKLPFYKRLSKPFTSNDRKSALAFGALTASIVLVGNFILLIFALTKRKYFGQASDRAGIFYKSECNIIRRQSAAFHVLINILSTMLLGASNYAMQCLSAPTRWDIDRAHSSGKWLDIGVPSLKNIRYIPRSRLLIWIALGLSSIPLHLLYNSAIFISIGSHVDHRSLVAPLDVVNFLSALPQVKNGTNITSNSIPSVISDPSFQANNDSLANIQTIIKSISTYRNMSTQECFTIYDPNSILPNYEDVVFVAVDIHNFTRDEQRLPSLQDFTVLNTEQSAAFDLNYNHNKSLYFEALPSYSRYEAQVGYCLAQAVPSYCELNYNLAILLTVILLNIFKIVLIFLTTRQLTDRPLTTIGDAIESFLDNLEAMVKNLATVGRKDFVRSKSWNIRSRNFQNLQHFPRTLGAASEKSWLARSWFHGATRSRWIICLVLCSFAMGIAIGLYVPARAGEHATISSLWSKGFGFQDTQSIYAFTSSISATITIANAPQLLISIVYLTYNALLSSLLVNREYISYSQSRKPLRTTEPKQGQYSTYYLQVPYRYAIPLMIWSFALHYFVSQSVFFVRIVSFNHDLTTTEPYNSVGWSSLGLLCAIITGGLGIMAIILIGFRKYPGLLPIGGTCSASIAAACWRPEDDVHASTKGVMWGELVVENDGESSSVSELDLSQDNSMYKDVGKIKHLCFTSFPVIPPQGDTLYI